jgi:UDP-3-O-[3-hydroxymyristoyl] glucosamine N-acyltransferase
VIGDVPPNSVYSGYPARPHTQQMRVLALLQRLPEIVEKLKEIEKKIEEIEKGGTEK